MVISISFGWIGLDFVTLCFSEIYNNIFWFFLIGIAGILGLLLVGIFAYKIEKLLVHKKHSNIMSAIYGDKVGSLVSFASVAQSLGTIGLQIYIASTILLNCCAIPKKYAVFIYGILILGYSSQRVDLTAHRKTLLAVFYTIVFLVLGYSIFLENNNFISLSDISFINDTPLNFKITELNLIFYCSLCLYFLIKFIEPGVMQKILICKNASQVSRVFKLSSLICATFHIIACLTILTIIHNNPDLDIRTIFLESLNKQTIPGIRALTVIAILIPIISSSFWWLSPTTIILSEYVFKYKNELWKIFFAIITITSSAFIASFTDNPLELFMISGTFYMPLTAAPLILAILGFRSGRKGVLMSMIFGIATVVIWIANDLKWTSGIDSLIPSVFICTIYFFLAHYMLGEPGGWSKDN
jgi:hypothetical protein